MRNEFLHVVIIWQLSIVLLGSGQHTLNVADMSLRMIFKLCNLQCGVQLLQDISWMLFQIQKKICVFWIMSWTFHFSHTIWIDGRNVQLKACVSHVDC